jgi:DNA-binding IclR family transcriptional regulator
MARPSPGTQRVLAILNFLANSPGKAFSLTDLISGLRMNRSTCHSLTNELVNAGYLYRTRDKLYVLGPAAAQLGRAANLHASPLEIAIPEMSAIANRHDVICSAIFREGGDVLVRERAISVSHLGWPTNRDARWPLRPPFGAIFLAWSSDKDVEGWFDSLAPSPSIAERQRTKEGMIFAREHGFQFVVRQMPEEDNDESMEWLFVRDPAKRPLEIGTSLENALVYALTSMSSPVFEMGGKVAFTLGLTGFSRPYSGSEIHHIGTQLRSACQRITNFSGKY